MNATFEFKVQNKDEIWSIIHALRVISPVPFSVKEETTNNPIWDQFSLCWFFNVTLVFISRDECDQFCKDEKCKNICAEKKEAMMFHIEDLMEHVKKGIPIHLGVYGTHAEVYVWSITVDGHYYEISMPELRNLIAQGTLIPSRKAILINRNPVLFSEYVYNKDFVLTDEHLKSIGRELARLAWEESQIVTPFFEALDECRKTGNIEKAKELRRYYHHIIARREAWTEAAVNENKTPLHTFSVFGVSDAIREMEKEKENEKK